MHSVLVEIMLPRMRSLVFLLGGKLVAVINSMGLSGVVNGGKEGGRCYGFERDKFEESCHTYN